jgi:hypothetical protein
MSRLWRNDPGLLLIAFMLIDLGIWTYVETAGSRLNAYTNITAQQLGWTAIDAFLLWRVWRGSRVAWFLLLLVNVAVLVQMGIGGDWNAYEIGLEAFLLVQVLILVAPAVRRLGSRCEQPAS